MTSFRQYIIDNIAEYDTSDYECVYTGLHGFTEDGLVDFVFDMILAYNQRRSEDDDRGTDS